MTRRWAALLTITACAAAVALPACGGSGGSGEPGASVGTETSSRTGAGAADAVAIEDFAYAPANLTVRKGAEVSFTNRDSTEHTATASGGGFDTGSIGKGQTKAVRLDTAGTFAYVCTFHPFMHGTITVR